jgi:hypothetical protein
VRSRCSRRSSVRASPTTCRRDQERRALNRLPRDVRLGCRDRRTDRAASISTSSASIWDRSARRRARCTAVRTVGSPPITGGAWPTRAWPTSVSMLSVLDRARTARRAGATSESASTSTDPRRRVAARIGGDGSWDLPQALEDAVVGRHEDRPALRRYACRRRRSGDRVSRWSTINEPWCAACSATARSAGHIGAVPRRRRPPLAAHGCGRCVAAGRSPAHLGRVTRPVPGGDGR